MTPYRQYKNITELLAAEKDKLDQKTNSLTAEIQSKNRARIQLGNEMQELEREKEAIQNRRHQLQTTVSHLRAMDPDIKLSLEPGDNE